jgi:hypothetical protein
LANQLLIFAEAIPQCLLCGCTKPKEIRSHIFPKCLLQQHGEIHSTGGHFIWDMSRKSSRTLMAASGLSFPLFCDTCEKEASKYEGFLRDTYLKIMAAGMEEDIELNDADYVDLKYILAVILFRGALQTINIIQEILIPGYLNDFFEIFVKLQKFCLKKTRAQDLPLKIFLLPNGNINPDNKEPTYLLDFELRNPQYTSIVTSEGIPFMYMKFDCFHCVLPFHPGAQPFHGIPIETGKISPTKAMNDFPQSLLCYNLREAELLLYPFVELQLSSDICIAIQTSKEKLNQAQKGYRYPAKTQRKPGTKKKTRQDAVHLLEQAKGFSPLRPRAHKLEKSLKAEEEKHRHTCRKLTGMEKVCKTLDEENKTLKVAYKTLLNKFEKLKTERDEESDTPVSPVQENFGTTAPEAEPIIQEISATPATPRERQEERAEAVYSTHSLHTGK